MKTLLNISSVILILSLFSCSSNIKISSGDDFERIELPDGSIASLNANSSIEYDENFEQRVISQEGEVFYIVNKGENPFIVKTEDGEIKVTGTEFNVKSGKHGLEIEVEKGSVELKIGKEIRKIIKGQNAFFRKNIKGIKIGNAKFKHKKWMHNFNKKFHKQLEKDFNKHNKNVEKDLKKINKDVNKNHKKFEKDMKKTPKKNNKKKK